MNPLNEADIRRLKQAATWSRAALKPFRQKRIEALREYVGAHYSDDGAPDRVPVNLLELAINIYVRQLVASRPQALVTTRHRELRAFAGIFESTVNDAVIEANLEATLRQAVMNAMFSIAIVKVGITEGLEVDLGDKKHDAGKLYADCIGLDDWVHDMTARSRSGWQFCGNRWSMRLDQAKENPAFDPDARARLVSHDPSAMMEDGEERASAISRGRISPGADEAEFRPRVELWDYYLPQERLLVTCNADIDVPLRIVEDDGPSQGPYHYLGFSDVPDSIMPLPPVALMRDIHELVNRLYRKLGRQADRQKTITGVQGSADKDGERIVKADDGDVVKLDNPNNAKEYKFGGVAPESLAFLIQTKDLYSYLNGNLDSLGGLSPQSRTLGQDELLSSSASQRIADMQARTLEFTTGIIKSFAWWTWTDPVREQLVQRRMMGTAQDVNFEWTPETRNGDFLQYNFDVNPFSMAHSTPAMKLQGLLNFLQGMVFPALPMLEAQGKTINFDSLVKTVSRLGNIPEVEDVIVDSGAPTPIMEGPAEGDPQPKVAPVTKRTYERVNRPGGTRQGQDAVTVRALMGAASQPEEMAAVGKGY